MSYLKIETMLIKYKDSVKILWETSGSVNSNLQEVLNLLVLLLWELEVPKKDSEFAVTRLTVIWQLASPIYLDTSIAPAIPTTAPNIMFHISPFFLLWTNPE